MKISYNDSKNFIGKLTARKIFNYLKLWSSYHLSFVTKKNLHRGLPYSLTLELTNHCNLFCPGCPVGTGTLKRNKGNMGFNQFQKIIDETASYLAYLMLYFQGEPYLNKNVFDMISYAGKKNIYTSLATNAQLINDDYAKKTIESGLDRIIISIDGTTQEIYEKYRKGGSLNKVVDATESLAKWKKQLKSATPFIVHQFLVTGENEHQLVEIFALSKHAGADKTELKTVQITDFENQKYLLPKNDKYARYKKDATGAYRLKKNSSNKCFRSWSSAVSTWDGMIVPCCFDKDAEHVVGSISENTIEEIFCDSKFNNFRKKILEKRNEISICNNCTE